jgi:L-lactate dehydrogenase complex protein LldG
MSKADILQSIRKHKPVFPAVSYHFTEQPVLSSTELKDLFIQSLKAAGAEIIEDTSAWDNVLDFTQPAILAEYPANCPLDKLNKIEHALFRGNFGVAENGAIWLEDKDLPHRIIPFITQHLILKLDANKIVADMQEAYRQIQLKDTGYGVFISGPSKTADIEQSLVYGAHGAKELSVLLVSTELTFLTECFC